jgi:hypothetical protein
LTFPGIGFFVCGSKLNELALKLERATRMPVRAQPLRVKFNEKPAVSLLSLSKNSQRCVKLRSLRETLSGGKNKTARTIRTAQHARNLNGVSATWLAITLALRQLLLSSSFILACLAFLIVWAVSFFQASIRPYNRTDLPFSKSFKLGGQL